MLLRNSGTSPQTYMLSCCCVRHYLCSRSVFACSYQLIAKQTSSTQFKIVLHTHVQSSVLVECTALHITLIDLHVLLLIRFLVYRALCVSHATFSYLLLLLRHHEQM